MYCALFISLCCGHQTCCNSVHCVVTLRPQTQLIQKANYYCDSRHFLTMTMIMITIKTMFLLILPLIAANKSSGRCYANYALCIQSLYYRGINAFSYDLVSHRQTHKTESEFRTFIQIFRLIEASMSWIHLLRKLQFLSKFQKPKY